jgi:hypothetical protein
MPSSDDGRAGFRGPRDRPAVRVDGARTIKLAQVVAMDVLSVRRLAEGDHATPDRWIADLESLPRRCPVLEDPFMTGRF